MRTMPIVILVAVLAGCGGSGGSSHGAAGGGGATPTPPSPSPSPARDWFPREFSTDTTHAVVSADDTARTDLPFALGTGTDYAAATVEVPAPALLLEVYRDDALVQSRTVTGTMSMEAVTLDWTGGELGLGLAPATIRVVATIGEEPGNADPDLTNNTRIWERALRADVSGSYVASSDTTSDLHDVSVPGSQETIRISGNYRGRPIGGTAPLTDGSFEYQIPQTTITTPTGAKEYRVRVTGFITHARIITYTVLWEERSLPGAPDWQPYPAGFTASGGVTG